MSVCLWNQAISSVLSSKTHRWVSPWHSAIDERLPQTIRQVVHVTTLHAQEREGLSTVLRSPIPVDGACQRKIHISECYICKHSSWIMLTKQIEISFQKNLGGVSYLKAYRPGFKNTSKILFGKLHKVSPNFTTLQNDSFLKNAPRFNLIHREKTAQHVALLLKDHSCLPRGQNATAQWWTPRFTNQLHFWKGKVFANLGVRKDWRETELILCFWSIESIA